MVYLLMVYQGDAGEKMTFKEKIKAIFRFLKFVIIFGIYLAALVFLEQLGGLKLIAFILIAFCLAVYTDNKGIIEEYIADVIHKSTR